MENETRVTNLVTVLEHATVMAKQLPSTTDSATIYASLHAAHRHLSLFLAHTTQSPPPQQQLQADSIDEDEPMRIADEEDSKIETMEERLKDISIQQRNNKRLKRSLSSASLDCQIESARARFDYDPHVARLRALDLIFQFHC
ncbi:hypothetical protein HanRHA438_Chr04g0193941 [Helianthus annuus]|uniref:Uncharacterized protein n=1 Tax=Helianthus annuus TaxID=4232 RepID=A0A251V275_HELAN|nr:uncharacterized protein LOC110935197 [Helianthus annuus]KAF5811679.1 hypothetical protein HanXRQr2_Chr04g0184191 [Helianthus annuus]KAJ0598278.1 hypothetical protein HanHA89_Chr04g0164051 [Helianthus annuus]KAJ0762555.1 hypothetical protein HanOQP8_Chr04g0162661 [Helianthus annuus]KAJ0928427.1 hypothetical protein HanRHA438_Chr04g0193941 [Helianthus annuus]